MTIAAVTFYARHDCVFSKGIAQSTENIIVLDQRGRRGCGCRGMAAISGQFTRLLQQQDACKQKTMALVWRRRPSVAEPTSYATCRTANPSLDNRSTGSRYFTPGFWGHKLCQPLVKAGQTSKALGHHFHVFCWLQTRHCQYLNLRSQSLTRPIGLLYLRACKDLAVVFEDLVLRAPWYTWLALIVLSMVLLYECQS